MAQRIRVGLRYLYSENWIAGAYYIENLIHALNTLPDAQKPYLKILSYNEKDFERIKQITNYPYLSFFSPNTRYNLLERIINKIYRSITKKNLIEKLPNHKKIDILFPAFEGEYFSLISDNRKFFWIPDFQEDYLPQFFSQEEIKNRKNHQKQLSEKKTNIVFSSQDASNDFNRLYPNHQCQTFVLRFAVTHSQTYQVLDIRKIREKYQLPENYFFSPNQFWAHKNHIVVLKAARLLKEQNIDFCIAFSGKQEDYRNPEYFKSLEKYVQENYLENNIKFLGFIERNEQLALMKHAQAIIQPSLFEGWSTVVEDAKAMNQTIILSDLRVHKEQTADYEAKLFFNPNDENDLAEKILSLQSNRSANHYNYKATITRFGENFMQIVSQIVN
jgi:glycosyltransferase involved in cell wall biosynthesis